MRFKGTIKDAKEGGRVGVRRSVRVKFGLGGSLGSPGKFGRHWLSEGSDLQEDLFLPKFGWPQCHFGSHNAELRI